MIRLPHLTVLALLMASPATAQSGEALFKARCATCHSVKPGGASSIGPNLFGIVGAKAASGPYRYSDALRKSGIRWDTGQLDKWLTRPAGLVPGTRMFTAVPDPAMRKSLIDYLASQRK